MTQMEVRTSSDRRPLPQPDDVTRFHWDAATTHRLVLQRCRACGKLQYPPEVCWIHRQADDFEQAEATGRGVIYSYSIVDRPLHAGFVDALPYVVALVELDDQPGLRMLTNLVDVPAGHSAGMAGTAGRGRIRGPRRGHAAAVQTVGDGHVSSLTRPVAIAGVGYSHLSRTGAPDPRNLALTAAKAAVSDAGLRSTDIDGIFEYKFGP